MITVDQKRQLTALWDEYPDHFMRKFCLSPDEWYWCANRIASGLGLCDSPPLRILDIGCGLGYFQRVCCDFGHDTAGIDVSDELIRRGATILDVLYTGYTIRPGMPMPKSFTGYDLITTFGVNFRHTPDWYWGANEYEFLAADIRKRLKPGGRWVLRPNQTDKDQGAIADLSSRKWWQEVAGPDATITQSGPEITITWKTN